LGFAEFVLESWHILGNCPVSRKRVGKNMVSDSVGDALVRIKNGYKASLKEVGIPYSKLVFNLCNLLVKEGFVLSCKKEGERDIKVALKYEGRDSVLTDVKRISKPGLRVYQGSKSLPRVLNGLGIAIISTPKGLMTDRQARKEKLGGEVMAYVW
jgi:small subunit ribosomal protein S8